MKKPLHKACKEAMPPGEPFLSCSHSPLLPFSFSSCCWSVVSSSPSLFLLVLSPSLLCPCCCYLPVIPVPVAPCFYPTSSCSQWQLGCCHGGGPHHPRGAMVGVFTALPVPCPLSLSSCGGPVVPLTVAPLSAL